MRCRVTGLFRTKDEEVLHHADILMRQNVTMEDGLAGPFLETHADDDYAFRRYPHGVLYGAGRLSYAIDRNHLKRVDVNVEGMAFDSARMTHANAQVPLLRIIQVHDDRLLLLGVDRIVDQVVAANGRVDQRRRCPRELDHPDTPDFGRLDQRIEALGNRQLARQSHVFRGAGHLDLGDNLFRAHEKLLVLSELPDTVDSRRRTRLHQEVGAVCRGEEN